jgi:hypothetical protein
MGGADGDIKAGVEPRLRLRNSIAHDAFTAKRERVMNSIIYFVGLIVVVLAILSFLGLR